MSSSVAEAVTKERLHSSGEDYLKAIFILEAQHGSVRSVEVAEYMNVSKASVNHAVRERVRPSLPAWDTVPPKAPDAAGYGTRAYQSTGGQAGDHQMP